jgi:hypothetical protein
MQGGICGSFKLLDKPAVNLHTSGRADIFISLAVVIMCITVHIGARAGAVV